MFYVAFQSLQFTKLNININSSRKRIVDVSDVISTVSVRHLSISVHFIVIDTQNDRKSKQTVKESEY